VYSEYKDLVDKVIKEEIEKEFKDTKIKER
jgi:hypothetical protein